MAGRWDRQDAPQAGRSPQSVTCPACGMPPGEPCLHHTATPDHPIYSIYPHEARVAAARSTAVTGA